MSEFVSVAGAALGAVNRDETVCLVTVVRVRGSAPRHASARMLIWPDGKTFGTIGGGTLESRVIDDARSAFVPGRPQFKNYVFETDGNPDSVGLCGGSVDVTMEFLRPDPTLLLIGAGHIAQAIARMAAFLELRVVVVDDRIEWANRERFPTAAETHVVQYEPSNESLAPIPVPMTPSTFVVIATWGYDLPALEQVLEQNPAYIALVASPTKAKEFVKRLTAKGFSPEALERVNAPAGLDLGAESPAEVALAILAEVLASWRGGTGRPLRDVRGTRPDSLAQEKVKNEPH